MSGVNRVLDLHLLYIITGYTALHRAACWNRNGCLRILIANDADLQLKNIHGERARECAARYNNISCVELLDVAGKYSICLG